MKTVCDCGTPLTEEQIKRGTKYHTVQCAGKYRPKSPQPRGFGFECPESVRPRVGVGFRAFVDGEGYSVPYGGGKGC